MKILYTLLFTFLFFSLAAQEGIIKLRNPSFEDTPRHSKPPRSWYNCGPKGESPPDLHPSKSFEVKSLPYDGKTFVGMVTRDNNTWEGLAQHMPLPFKANQKYHFSLYLARSPFYMSYSRIRPEYINYNIASKLRIWAGHDYCQRQQLLAETEAIEHADWREYQFILKPKENFEYFLFEIYYTDPKSPPCNGNILIDKASAIVPID